MRRITSYELAYQLINDVIDDGYSIDWRRYERIERRSGREAAKKEKLADMKFIAQTFYGGLVSPQMIGRIARQLTILL